MPFPVALVFVGERTKFARFADEVIAEQKLQKGI